MPEIESYGSNREKMAAECNEFHVGDIDDNQNAVVRPKSFLQNNKKPVRLQDAHTDTGADKLDVQVNNEDLHLSPKTPSTDSSSSESPSTEVGSNDDDDDTESLIPRDIALCQDIDYELLSSNYGSDDSFTPISPEPGDWFCASKPQSLDDPGYPYNSYLRPEAHPYLEWEELFALTDYVHLGSYNRGDQLASNCNGVASLSPNGHLTGPSNKPGEISIENDDNSSRSSDLFDVFVNPVHYSASDETESDEVLSSNDSESVVSETDSDISKPRKSNLRDPRRPRTPPGTPSRKTVRFADALGLDLETVRHILELDPGCPSPPIPSLNLDGACQRNVKSVLRFCFDQPGGRPDFLHRLYTQNICLENVVVSDMTVVGTIKVRNLNYNKEVRVRYSWDCWSSHCNVLAVYVAGSCDGPTDRFSFAFTVPRSHTGLGDKVFFAVFYQVGGQVYWDNNIGHNYLMLVEEEIKRKKSKKL